MAVEQPTKTRKTGPNDAEVYTHPAFAQISVGRITGNVNLYGSDLSHRHAIHLTIARSKMERSLSSDRHFEQEELIELYLSEHDWATLLSSMNVGGGVPCTLRHVMGKPMPEIPPPPSRRQQFKQEAEETVRDAFAQLNRLGEQLDELNISAKARAALSQSLRMAKQELQSNLPFVLECFDEHMEKTVAAGKQELISYAQQHNLLEQLKQLTNSNKG